MLKETENEKNKTFLNIFIIGGISIEGDPGRLVPPPPAPGYVYYFNSNAICDIKILCAFLLVCPCVYVNATQMVLFRMIMLSM